MTKIKCIFDNKQFTTKPEGFEVGGIINRMTIDKIREYSLEEIKNNILLGHTIRPSDCGGREDSWQSQQIFMIDIDNKPSKPKGMSDNEYQKLCQEYLENNHRTYNDIIDHCKNINLIPAFIYTSFNHKDVHHKMRLVFILDNEIIDINIAKKIQLYLMAAIGEVDEQCKNLNRIYYAGKNMVFDNGNILKSDKLIELSRDISIDCNDSKSKRQRSKTVDNQSGGEKGYNILNELNNLSNILYPLNPPQSQNDNQYNIKAIKERNTGYLKNKINNVPIEFENESDFWHYVYRINMAELLELKYPKAINCLFHEDNSPSASVFQNNDGIWLYKCHSGSCGLIMNNKQLIEKLGNFKSEYKAIKFIKDIYNLSIKETEWSIEQKENIDRIIQSLSLNEFAEICPQTNSNIRYVKDLFLVLLSIAKDNVYGENYCNSDGDAVFFVSLNELSKKVNISINRLNVLSQRLAVLIYHDLVRKLDDDKIPEALLKKAQALAIDKKHKKRVNFYAIPSWVFEHLKNIEMQGNKWKKNGYTVKGTSYEMFFRGDGLEVAQRIYPQHKKVMTKLINYETGEFVRSIQDRTTSKTSDERVFKIVDSIEKLISEKGFTSEKELIFYLSKEYRWDITEIQLRKMRGQLEQLGFKRTRANKIIKDQYGITSDGYPFLIIKAS